MEAHKILQELPGIIASFFEDENQDRVEDIVEHVKDAAELVVLIANDLFNLGLPVARSAPSELYDYVLREIDKGEGV